MNISLFPIRLALISTAVATLAQPVLSHEFWLDTQDYFVAPGQEISVDIRNGQEFRGMALSYLDNRIARFDRIFNGEKIAVEGRAGDMPALSLSLPEDGLLVLAYESTSSTLVYADWEKFGNFIAHKDFADTEARHTARGLPRENFTEVYTRFSKALIGVGTGAGADRDTGMLTEFIALANPYADNMTEGLPVRLLFDGAPRTDAQVEVFARDPEGQVTITKQRTDAQGEAVIAVKPGYDYLLDAVILREPDAKAAEESGAVWESLWAALTFGVPAR